MILFWGEFLILLYLKGITIKMSQIRSWAQNSLKSWSTTKHSNKKNKHHGSIKWMMLMAFSDRLKKISLGLELLQNVKSSLSINICWYSSMSIKGFLMRSSKKSIKRAVALLTTCKTCWGSRSKMHVFVAVTWLSEALKKIGSFILGTISLIKINTCATSVWAFSCWKEETSKNSTNRNGSRSLTFHSTKMSLSRRVWIHIRI